MERKDGEMTITLGLYSYEALEKHIHEMIDDFIESGAADNTNFANGAFAIDAVVSIILDNRELYFNRYVANLLVELLRKHEDFKTRIPDRMQKSSRDDEVEETIRTIWVMLFHKVLVENYVEFREKWYSRRVEYGESGKI